MNRRYHSRLLLLLAVVLLACPVTARIPCEMTVHQDEDACHTGSATDAPVILAEDSNPTPPLDGHCSTECFDCGLPCCTGQATLLTFVPSLPVRDSARTTPVPATVDMPTVDCDPIYHPPRV